MNRVPAQIAARIGGVSRCTLHRWVREGRLERYADGYDLAEIEAARDGRDMGALLTRAGIRHADRPPLAPSSQR